MELNTHLAQDPWKLRQDPEECISVLDLLLLDPHKWSQQKATTYVGYKSAQWRCYSLLHMKINEVAASFRSCKSVQKCLLWPTLITNIQEKILWKVVQLSLISTLQSQCNLYYLFKHLISNKNNNKFMLPSPLTWYNFSRRLGRIDTSRGSPVF